MASSSDIHISIAAEPILDIGGFEITNAMLGALVVSIGLCIAAVVCSAFLKKNGLPGPVQNAIEWYYVTLEAAASDNIGSRSKARPYLGLVLTLFLFIVLGSWLGLIPGVLHIGLQVDKSTLYPLFRAPTTDLNATIALSIIAFLTIQYAGFSSLGLSYLGKFFQFNSGPLNAVVGLLELVSEFVRLISFSFRLFGNIFAGEVLIIVINSLTKFNAPESGPFSFLNYIGVPFPIFIIGMETLVALIQAYVFVSLMSVFISLAAEKPHH